MENFIEKIRCELRQNADETVRLGSKKFFKEEIRLHGIKTATVSKISKEFYKQLQNKPKSEIFALSEKLWQTGYMEENFIACNWSYFVHNQYKSEDFGIFENWVNHYVTNWATCDTLCNHSVGTFIEMYPEYLSKLKEWAHSQNRWVKRASAVSLIVPAKKGKFLAEIFEIADILLSDTDDLVQKGYGWMLKAASKVHQKEVFEYVHTNKAIMPRTALRYAIEKMPDNLKKKAMEK